MRPAVLTAAGVVLAANAWVLGAASWNRGEALGGTLELTERELHLPRPIGESTALFLELEWDTPHSAPDHRGQADWLDTAKLDELGFDARLPDCGPEHCDGSEPSRPVFVVLELATAERADGSTRLLAIDAGLDPRRLRERYPDAQRHVVARGLVRTRVQPSTGVRGTLEAILPTRIFVPLPHNRILEDPRERGTDEEDLAENGPRFAATVGWGRRYEPRVEGVRLLEASD